MAGNGIGTPCAEGTNTDKPGECHGTVMQP
jgi:hypothetical protein